MENNQITLKDVVGVWSCGDKGDNVMAFLKKDGTLSYIGSGEMDFIDPLRGFDFPSPPWKDYADSIKTIIVNDGITSIEARAFGDCSNLTSITIGKDVKDMGFLRLNFKSLISIHIGKNVNMETIKHLNPKALKLLKISADNPIFCMENGVLFNKDKTVLISCSSTTEDSFVIPESVTVIRQGAFIDCDKLTDITIGNNVTSIEDNAFKGCNALISIDIPENVKRIGRLAFEDCNALNSINIGNNANLNFIDLIKTMSDEDLFVSLLRTSVENPNISHENGVLLINNKTVLERCSKNKQGTYVIPDCVKYIGINAFYDCNELTSIVIPNNVENIGSGALDYCNNLHSITIHNSIPPLVEVSREEYIDVEYTGYGTNQINSYRNCYFDGIDRDKCVLFVPANAVDRYRKSAGWKMLNIYTIEDNQFFPSLFNEEYDDIVEIIYQKQRRSSYDWTDEDITGGEMDFDTWFEIK